MKLIVVAKKLPSNGCLTLVNSLLWCLAGRMMWSKIHFFVVARCSWDPLLDMLSRMQSFDSPSHKWHFCWAKLVATETQMQCNAWHSSQHSCFIATLSNNCFVKLLFGQKSCKVNASEWCIHLKPLLKHDKSLIQLIIKSFLESQKSV